MYACSPKWKDWITEDQLDQLLCQLADKIAPSPYGPETVTLNHGVLRSSPGRLTSYKKSPVLGWS
jgi:hypothetical protein